MKGSGDELDVPGEASRGMTWGSFEGGKMKKVQGGKKAAEEVLKKRQWGDID